MFCADTFKKSQKVLLDEKVELGLMICKWIYSRIISKLNCVLFPFKIWVYNLARAPTHRVFPFPSSSSLPISVAAMPDALFLPRLQCAAFSVTFLGLEVQCYKIDRSLGSLGVKLTSFEATLPHCVLRFCHIIKTQQPSVATLIVQQSRRFAKSKYLWEH